MKCFKCGADINVDMIKCPKCGNNVSFTNVKDVNLMAIDIFHLMGPIVLFFLIPILIFFFSNFLIFKEFSRRVSNIAFWFGVGLLIINILMAIFNKTRKVNLEEIAAENMIVKRKGISLCWLLTSIILMCSPVIVKNVKVYGVIDMYSQDITVIKVKGIEIPSIYTVFGEKEIEYSIILSDKYDAGFKTNFDSIMITYKKITEEEKQIYINALINEYGYKAILVYDDMGDEIICYVRNENKNIFSMITIDGYTYNYVVADGQYEDKILVYKEL